MDKKKLKRPVPQKPNGKKNNVRTILFVLFIAGFLFLGLSSYGKSEDLQSVAFSDVIRRANNGEISKIEVVGDELKITKSGEEEPSQTSRKESGSSIYEQGLENRDVEVKITPENTSGEVWSNVLFTLAPVILLGGLLFWMMRSAQGQGNQAMSFGRSKARLYGNEKDKVTFKIHLICLAR